MVSKVILETQFFIKVDSSLKLGEFPQISTLHDISGSDDPDALPILGISHSQEK